MDDICCMLDNTNIWDAEQNWEIFLKDADDYRNHVFFGRMYDDAHAKKLRGGSYIKLKDLPPHLKHIVESGLKSWDMLMFSSLMLHFSDRLICFLEVNRNWKIHHYDVG